MESAVAMPPMQNHQHHSYYTIRIIPFQDFLLNNIMSYTSSPPNLEIIEGLLSVFRKNQIIRIELQDSANSEPDIHTALREAPLPIFISLVMLELDAALSRNIHLRETKFHAAFSQDSTLPSGLRCFLLLRHSAYPSLRPSCRCRYGTGTSVYHRYVR